MNACPLLDKLPRELRNIIYSFAATTEAAVQLRASTNTAVQSNDLDACPFISASPLAGTCKQIRSEYLEGLPAAVFSKDTTIKIRATVLDFDFTHVIKFLDQLKPTQLASLNIKQDDTVAMSHFYRTLSNAESESADLLGRKLNIYTGMTKRMGYPENGIAKWIAATERLAVEYRAHVRTSKGYYSGTKGEGFERIGDCDYGQGILQFLAWQNRDFIRFWPLWEGVDRRAGA